VNGYTLGEAADRSIDEIADYTRRLWGERQAVRYIEGLFAEFDAIAGKSVPWIEVPPTLGVSGYRRRYRHHFIYWKATSAGEIAIISILHERMQQALHLHERR